MNKRTVLVSSVLVLILLIVLVMAIDTQSTGWRVTTTEKTIDVHSNCWKAVKTSGLDVFAPTKTAGEWTAFIAGKPGSVTLSACVTETVSLSGTTSSYNFADMTLIMPVRAGWRFNSDGTVDKKTGIASSPSYIQFNALSEWVIPNNPSESYWIYATIMDSTSSPSSGTTGSCLSLSTTREWDNYQGGIGSRNTKLKIEIATDSSCSTVVATGYYRFRAQVVNL